MLKIIFIGSCPVLTLWHTFAVGFGAFIDFAQNLLCSAGTASAVANSLGKSSNCLVEGDEQLDQPNSHVCGIMSSIGCIIFWGLT